MNKTTHPPTKAKARRPLIGLAIESATSYGRSILRGATQYAKTKRHWQLHVDIWHAATHQKHFLPCDGAIIAGLDPDTTRLIENNCKQVVYCTGNLNDQDKSTVSLDDHRAGILAAEHLLNCQLAHFSFYGTTSDRLVANKRLGGFQQTIQAANQTLHRCPIDWPAGLSFVTQKHWPKLIDWLKQLPKPIGIMAADDAAAHDLAGVCQTAGIDVPDSVAIIGVNNDDLLCEGTTPALSSVEPDYTRVGYQAAVLLDHLIASKQTLPPSQRQIQLPPVGIIKRKSTDMLAIKNPKLSAAMQYIKQHACDPCKVDNVLQHTRVNRRWLERQFLKNMNRTPHQEIQRIRMEHACHLLHQPELTIKQVAEKCGFSATQHFYKAFRNYHQVVPGAYRRSIPNNTYTTQVST